MDELGLVSLVDTDAIHEPSLVPLDPNEGILSDSLASTPLAEPIASSLPQEDAKIDEGDAVIPRTQSGKREKVMESLLAFCLERREDSSPFSL